MACWAVVTAQFIGARAVRDALYLGRADAAATLPVMVIVASMASIALSFASARVLPRVPPSRFVPGLFVVSAVLLVIEWLLALRVPGVASVVVYLHVTGLGPMLGSGFWLIASEGFDPHTAKLRFGQIMGAGTLGGLMGGLLAERVAVVAGVGVMLLVLSVLSAVCAVLTWRLAAAGHGERSPVEIPGDLAPAAARSSLRTLRDEPYLSSLALLVLLGTAGVSLVDYLFKVEAAQAFGSGDDLLRFFAIFYAATSLITFVVQSVASSTALDRLGLGWLASTPSLAVLAGGLGALTWPGIASITAVRGGESVMRGSLFRASYEQLFTPVAARDKRAAKSIIDVAFDRAGDALGGGAIILVGMTAPATSRADMLVLAMVLSAVTLIVARRLHRGYIDSLARNLAEQVGDRDIDNSIETLTRFVPMRHRTGGRTTERAPATAPEMSDPVLSMLAALRSRDSRRVLEVLTAPAGIPDELVPHVIPLLAWNAVSKEAIAALRQSADRHVGMLVDALLDGQGVPVASRRRLARVFSVCGSQRAMDGLTLALDDSQFEVRLHCGRSMAAILDRNPSVRVDRDRVLQVVLSELATGEDLWRSRRVLDIPDAEQGPFVENVLNRTGQSLAHIFTLLSLVLPREPLQAAFLSLQTRDSLIRGTALEYLDRVLPRTIRNVLWPLLEKIEPPEHAVESSAKATAHLIHVHKTVVLNLEELKRGEKAGKSS